MQIKSSCESMCVDYYEIKDINGKIDTQNRLKVLTFMGETMKKGVINVWKMAEELDDYLQNYNYKVTINTKRPPQLVLKRRIIMYLSEHFGRAFWVDDNNEFRSCPLFVNNKPDYSQVDYVSEWTDLEGVRLDKLFNIHRIEILNRIFRIKYQIVTLFNRRCLQ